VPSRLLGEGHFVNGVPPAGYQTLPAADARPLHAMKLVAEKNWPQALATLRSVIEGATFSSLPRINWIGQRTSWLPN
jgi:hypothetical protein